MMEEGLSVIVLEKRSDIGGVWKYSDDPDVLTVMKGTQCTSSSTSTEISDFPMPDEMGEFPRHAQIYKYLSDYCDAFCLRPHIQLSCGVVKADKIEDKWEVLGEDGNTYISSKLVVCAGVHQKPNRELEDTLFSGYNGEIMHSGILKSFVPAHKGKRVMVVGGGETAADIVENWYDGGASQIIWSIPRGQHFFRKYAKILPNRNPQALDKASSRVMKTIAPHNKGKPGLCCFSSRLYISNFQN
jgi:dimethylaniline monooxygenase (N-oxide forming)